MSSYVYCDEGSLKDDPVRTFYALIDKTEIINDGNTVEFLFDGNDSRFLDQLRRNPGVGIQQLYQELTSHSVYLEFPRDGDVANSFKSGVYDFYDETKWYKIRLVNRRTDVPATIYNLNQVAPEPATHFLSSIESVPDDVSQALNNFFTAKNEEGRKESIEKLFPAPRIRGWHLTLYNVGQGNMSAICAGDRNYPLIYFDMGGGAGKGSRSYLNLKQPHTRAIQAIIISHWDWDHLETARRIWRNGEWDRYFKDKIWIAPKNPPPNSYAAFAEQIKATGRLIIWPSTYSNIAVNFWAGKLFKCEGPDKNNSGLALVVDCPANSIKKVLHPADAAFAYFPNFVQTNHVFDGLVASHHGANFYKGNNPVPISLLHKHGHIAYNYGLVNGNPIQGYLHPRQTAIDAYEKAEWTNRKDTIGGNLAFKTNLPAGIPICNNLDCDICNVQSF